MEFEGFEGQTELQPSDDQFFARKGVDATPSPGNGSLPPGAVETPGFPTANKTTAKTTDSFIKDTAA
jgi:hypothetical protein